MDTIKFHDWLERKNRMKKSPPRAAIAKPSPTLMIAPVSDATRPNPWRCLELKKKNVRKLNYHRWSYQKGNRKIKWITNLNVPIHSRGGLFNIIAWTKRRKLLKGDKIRIQ